jgi:excisionase family DNA binding protein
MIQTAAVDTNKSIEAATAFARASEAAAFLGLSTGMIHKMIGEGKMPSRRYGRAVRIPWAWLQKQAGE